MSPTDFSLLKTLLQALGSIIDPSAKEFAESIIEDDPPMARYANGALSRIKEGLKKLAVVKDEEYLEAETAQLDGFKIRYNNDPEDAELYDVSPLSGSVIDAFRPPGSK